jgi:hypothetical protein
MIQETGNISALVRCIINKKWHAIYDICDLENHKNYKYDRIIVVESACEKVWFFAQEIANQAGFYETLKLSEDGFTKLDRFVKE